MFQLEIDIADDIAIFQPGAFENATSDVLQFFDSDVKAHIQNEVTTRLAPYPGPVKLPIRWTPAQDQSKPPNTRWGYYSKQKAAYFATDGFGHGIPYRRTGGLGRAWTVTMSDQAGGIVVSNESPSAKYVIGARQQQFHKNTGWPEAEDTVFDILVDVSLQDIIANAWSKYLEGKMI